MDKGLLSKLDSFMQSSAQAQAKQQSISWEGQEADIPDVAAPTVTRARFEQLEAAAALAAVNDPMGLVRACGAYEKLMGSLADVLDVCGKHKDTNWSRVVSSWTEFQSSVARTARNMLLVRVAAVRAYADGGPIPVDEPALGRAQTSEETTLFVSASKDMVGSGPISCITVASILDNLASQAMPSEEAQESERRAAAALVLRYRGLRALYLARQQAHAKVWPEALALGGHAANLLEESGELGQADAKKEGAAARRELRIWKVSGQDGATAAAAEASSGAPAATSSSDVSSAKSVAAKPALFDLAAGDVKFPSLENRVKKKGFFGFW